MEFVVEFQVLFNAVAAIAGALGIFIIKYLFSQIAALRAENNDNKEKHMNLALKVAEEYVPNQHFQNTLDKVFAKLDQIAQKIDQKMDKT